VEPKFITSESQVTIERLYIMPRKPPSGVVGAQINDVVLMGTAVRGPVDTLVEITSPSRFEEVFGGRDYGAGAGTIFSEMWKALLHKPFGRIWCVRAAAAAGIVSTINLGTIVRADASSKGLWSAGLITCTVKAATNADANSWDLDVKYLGRTQSYINLLTTTGNDNLLVTLGDDFGNYVVLTKLLDGRPPNGDYVLVGGTDGAIADTDFTGAARSLEIGFGKRKGVIAWLVAGRSNSVIKAALKAKAAVISVGHVLMCPDAANTSAATANTEAAANTVPGGRIIYCFNHPSRVLDPVTGTFIVVEPHTFMASILSQTDAEQHVGDEDTKQYTAGINALTFAPDELVLDTARKAGVAELVEDDGGFIFQSGVTTDHLEIADVRAADWLNASIGDRLKHDVKKPNTVARRRAQVAVISQFLQEQKDAEHLVESFLVDGEALDTQVSRGQNKRKILVRGRLISHMNFIILSTEFGTQVVLGDLAA